LSRWPIVTLISVAASAALFGDPIGAWFLDRTVLVLVGVALTAYGGQR
jgi:hypothetical protein